MNTKIRYLRDTIKLGRELVCFFQSVFNKLRSSCVESDSSKSLCVYKVFKVKGSETVKP